MFLACSKDEVVNDITSTNNVSIGHIDDTLGISIVAVNATASDQNTNVNFTKDTIDVSLSVTGYSNGEATITFSNEAMDSKIFFLNSNQSIGQEPLLFTPTLVNVNVGTGYTGTVALAAISR
ncbi:MAG: hypothetical protein K8R37_12080 [Bacteroidales bacterium]|nr:hypothetical protein [Bacteroidales bacterium]